MCVCVQIMHGRVYDLACAFVCQRSAPNLVTYMCLA